MFENFLKFYLLDNNMLNYGLNEHRVENKNLKQH